MWTTPSIALTGTVFVLAGAVKGVVDFGLPVVAIHGLTEAISLMLVPSLATNIWTAMMAVAPAFAGMYLGQRLRQHIPEAAFRQTFFIALALMVAYLLWRAALAL